MFCIAMVSASNRLRNVVIDGSSSLRQPLPSVSGHALEGAKRTMFDLAGIDQHIELAQRVAGIGAFEIVLGAEQALPTGLALSARDCAERVEPAGDGREEALLGLDVGGNGPEQRRLRLVGAVGATEALYRGIGLPARFEQIVVAQPLIPAPEIRMVAAPGATGIGEHEDLLPVLHKRLRFGKIGMGRPVLNGESVATHIDFANNPPRAPCHLGYHVGSEPLDDLVERALHRLH
jgi:hypothetical protein